MGDWENSGLGSETLGDRKVPRSHPDASPAKPDPPRIVAGIRVYPGYCREGEGRKWADETLEDDSTRADGSRRERDPDHATLF